MTSELEEPVWSVLSDRGCEASGLTHEDARRMVHRLGGEGRHGLCIVTDRAAQGTPVLNQESDVSEVRK